MMKYKVDQIVAYEWINPTRYELGVITEVSKGAKYAYKIEFPCDEDIDWFREDSVDDMMQTLENMIKDAE